MQPLAVPALREVDPEAPKAVDSRSDDADVGPRRLECLHPGVGRSASIDLRVLDGNTRVPAPDVDAVTAHVRDPEPLDPDVGRAVADGYRDTFAGTGPAAVERELRDPDTMATDGEQREVTRFRRGGDHSARARAD